MRPSRYVGNDAYLPVAFAGVLALLAIATIGQDIQKWFVLLSLLMIAAPGVVAVAGRLHDVARR